MASVTLWRLPFAGRRREHTPFLLPPPALLAAVQHRTTGLSAYDAGTVCGAAGDSGGAGPDCALTYRQRQDRRLRHRPAGTAQSGILRLPGAGAEPDPGAG